LSALNEADITKRAKNGEVHYGKKESNAGVSRSKIILNELTEIDVDALTPRDALKKLYELKNKAEKV
ncbi:MAG: hypothetical protein LBU77_03450, partial [Clostridiales bacterium]|nr:hypothetical protein [Clostridiales bacterium]